MAVEDRVYIQSYIGRWEIEVNHHDEKDGLGIGQAQVWNGQSVPRTPALEVCCYAALLLSSIVTFADRRTEAFGPLPKWRKTSAATAVVTGLDRSHTPRGKALLGSTHGHAAAGRMRKS